MLCNILVEVYIRRAERGRDQFAMEYKPVHIISNDDTLLAKIVETEGIEYVVGAEDYTQEEGLHYHILVDWPITDNRQLSPTRQGAVGRWRREGNPCPVCYGRNSNYKCGTCGVYYKFIWAQSAEHHQNIRGYIEAKIQADPRVDLLYVEEP